MVKRLKRELCAQAQVRHPAVVTILDQNTDVGASLRRDGAAAAARCASGWTPAGGKGLPVAQSIRTFLQLSYALRAAHAQGLTHHNIKPENVLFDAYGNAKIGDFGLSPGHRGRAGQGHAPGLRGHGVAQLPRPGAHRPARTPGPRRTSTALGILLYEMLTGGIPGRRSPLPSEVNSEVPSKLDPIFDKMTHDRRESRYPDFDAMLDEFYGAFSDGEYLDRGDLVLSSEPPGA